MMHTQQISLFNLNSISKSSHLLGDQFDIGVNKNENPNSELINPFFFAGLSVFIDLTDTSQKKTAECVLKITGATIIDESNHQENIFNADIIVTDKEIYKIQPMINQKNGQNYGENQIDPFISFHNQRSQISTSNKKSRSIIINPEQIPWAFITTPLQNDIAQNWLNEALLPPPIPPSFPTIQTNAQQQSMISSNSIYPSLPEETKNARKVSKNQRNGHQINQVNGFQNQIQSQKVPLLNNTNLASSNGMIVVADSTMRTAPNYCTMSQMPEIRSKPLPDGLRFISPFVNDENIIKLYKERSETLIANSNINIDNVKINNSISIPENKSKKKGTPKKNSSKGACRSNAAACRYCGICKKSVIDEEKHRSSMEHKQNVSKQFLQVDELIQSFSSFPYI